jgi:hypothetical protein
MMDPMTRLRDPITQSHKFRNQVVVANQSARHTRPYPPTRIGECRKFAVKNVELETLPSCPCSAGRLVFGDQQDCPARLARIAPPENAQPIAFCSHLGALDTVDISRKLCSGQPVSFHRRRPAMPKAGWPAAHPSRLAGLAQSVEGRATRHRAVRPIAEPRASNHEVVAVRLGLKSEDAAGLWISPFSEGVHNAIFSPR